MYLLHSTQLVKNLRGKTLDFLRTKVELEGDDPLNDQIQIKILSAWEVGFGIEVTCDALGGDAVFGVGRRQRSHVDDVLVLRRPSDG